MRFSGFSAPHHAAGVETSRPGECAGSWIVVACIDMAPSREPNPRKSRCLWRVGEVNGFDSIKGRVYRRR